MPVYNFGMLTAGLPNPAMRQASSNVTDAGLARSSYLTDWQQRWDAATPTIIPGWSGYSSGPWSQASVDSVLANGGDPEMVSVARNGVSWGGQADQIDNSAREALEAEKAKTLADLNSQFANQQMQQNAYSAAGGGSFLGGNINAAYATPQTGLDPMGSLNGMLNAQPWSMPGFGGPNGGQSQAGFGGPSALQTQPQGWGGPFTARNPWSAS